MKDIINPTTKEQTLSISGAQKEIMRLPDLFGEELEEVTVTRYGKPVMSILPFEVRKTEKETINTLKQTIDRLQEEIDGLLETLEILKDEETMAAFRQGVEDIEAGRVIPLDDVLKELGWE
jgi:antitoxin (DNA-binding transcriptional repressor) of toxin-antitoxin stability system